MRVLLSIALAVLAWHAPARAQDVQLGGQRFQPAGSADGVLGTEGAETRPDFDPYVALWAHYALDPAVFTVDNRGVIQDISAVEHLVALDLVLGLSLAYGFEVGAALPLSVVRSGDDVGAGLVPSQSGAALGDIALRLAWRLQISAHTALAIHVPFFLPSASEENVLALGLGVRPTLVFSQWIGDLQLLLSPSFLVRESTTLADYRGGNEVGVRLAGRFRVGDRTALLAELGLSTATRDVFSGPTTPLEARLGIEQQLGRKLLLSGFVGVGLSGAVGSPDFRVGIGLAFVDEVSRHAHPRSGDRDGDGVRDVDDRCLDDGEDADGFEDSDGCPDNDDDHDGFSDLDDECPRAPETHNGILDDDGCPDLIQVEEGQIVTLQPVHFESNSEVIEGRSYPMLDEIAATLVANPQLALSVEGHADASGNEAHNLNLSQRRADSVRQYLIEHGVDPARVNAQGFGEAQSIATNADDEGRALNRRVEFHLGTIQQP